MICNLDQLSDLLSSTAPTTVAEQHECEKAAGGEMWMGGRCSQAASQLKSPLVKLQLLAYLCSGTGIRGNSPAVPEITLKGRTVTSVSYILTAIHDLSESGRATISLIKKNGRFSIM